MKNIPAATWITAAVLVSGIIATWAVNNYRIEQNAEAIDSKVDNVIYDLAVSDFDHRMDTVEAKHDELYRAFNEFKIEITAKETADTLEIRHLQERE